MSGERMASGAALWRTGGNEAWRGRLGGRGGDRLVHAVLIDDDAVGMDFGQRNAGGQGVADAEGARWSAIDRQDRGASGAGRHQAGHAHLQTAPATAEPAGQGVQGRSLGRFHRQHRGRRIGLRREQQGAPQADAAGDRQQSRAAQQAGRVALEEFCGGEIENGHGSRGSWSGTSKLFSIEPAVRFVGRIPGGSETR